MLNWITFLDASALLLIIRFLIALNGGDDEESEESSPLLPTGTNTTPNTTSKWMNQSASGSRFSFTKGTLFDA